LTLTIAIVGSAQPSAHRVDEYLQASRLAIDPRGVQIELDLTPGIALAEAIIAEIDRNRDGSPSAEEQRAYASLVLHGLEVTVDGRPLPVQLGSIRFADNDAMRRGEGTIHVQVSVTLPDLDIGAHQLRFRNNHHPHGSVYLANALVPESDEVGVTAQRRDPDQRELTIDYELRAVPAPSTVAWLLASFAAASMLSVFLIPAVHPVTALKMWRARRKPGLLR